MDCLREGIQNTTRKNKRKLWQLEVKLLKQEKKEKSEHSKKSVAQALSKLNDDIELYQDKKITFGEVGD